MIRFEERQQLRFCIYDIDGPSSDLASHDFLGSVECTLGEQRGVSFLFLSMLD